MVKRKYKVIWDDAAKASLRRIYNYIKKRESKEQAARVRSEIKKEGDSLGFIPHKYASDPFMEKDPKDIQYRIIWSYRIIYQITKENIAILDVIHTSPANPKVKLEFGVAILQHEGFTVPCAFLGKVYTIEGSNWIEHN